MFLVFPIKTDDTFACWPQVVIILLPNWLKDIIAARVLVGAILLYLQFQKKDTGFEA